ncbi:hypothetical protein SAMN05216203_0970 [Marinobacter daqiaonensis]|uniref:Uncharacterized protein n=1 Tax=Marinobacter daqiaonensis TaxID=650891 RepID=A0A1I6H7E4_9GAMM|nr:hypothetical protein [Marinobacter daqiaonensis]SFR50476.1 hypothetical protein SAMN05216203_0970 [Marinobacter daqiaonensis]
MTPRLAAILASALLPMGAVGQELTDTNPYLHPADPLVERERASQVPRLFWAAAKRPDHWGRKGRVVLDAGETATFELAPQGHLRLQSNNDEGPPLLWLSREGELWWQASWTPGSKDHEWFHAGDKPSPLFARLEAETHFRGRLFAAETDPVDAPDPYREVTLTGSPERVELVDDEGDRLGAHRLSEGETLEVDIEGPVILAIASRPTEAAEHQQQYSLSWSLDGAPWQQISIARTQFSTVYQIVDGSSLHGGMDRRYLVIPGGEHRLQIRASLPLLARIEQAEENYFLDSNEPEPTTAELTRALLEEALAAGGRTLKDLEALRQSNHIQGAADIALAYLEQGYRDQDHSGQGGAAWPGARSHTVAQALAGNIERSQRFFRNLFPDSGTGPLTMNTAWFSTTSPLELDSDEHYYLGEGVRDRLSRGLFVELGEEPLAYPLPPRSGPSRLRLSVARLLPQAAYGADAGLWIQYDDASPQRFRLMGPALRTRLSIPENALLSQGQAQGLSGLHPTLSGDFTSEREAGHYWPTATTTLPLPPNVREVRIWSGARLPVALQYRASQAYEAGENAYRTLLERTPPDSLVERLHQAFAAIPNPESEPLTPTITPQRALENQWYPMLRYLHAAQAAYLDSFSAREPAGVSDNLDERLKRARAKAGRGDWIGVLEVIGRSGYGQDPEAYRISQQALEALGEHYLARRQRQATAVFATDAEARRLATDELLTDYARTQRWASQVRLLAARFLREGDGGLIEPLGEALHRAGDSLWASQLGLLLAGEGRMPDWLPEAAQQAGWAETADTFEDRALHQGDLAARQGKTTQATERWEQAGEAGLARITRMRDAEAIASALASRDRERRLAGIERWLAWSLSSQQDYDWVSVDDRVESSSGFSTLLSGVSGTPFALPHASADVPLELEVVGPAVLRVQLRRLAPDGPEPGDIDWLTAELVDAAGTTKRLRAPVLSRTENPYLETINKETGISTGDDILLEVPSGLHQVRLRPRDNDYLAQLWQWRPKHTWEVLPPVTPLALKDLLQGFSRATGFRRGTEPDYFRIHEAELEPLPVLPPAQLHTVDLVLPGASDFGNIPESLQFPDQAVGPGDWPVGSYAVQVQNVRTDGAVPESPQVAHALAVALLWQLEQSPGLMDRVSARLAQLAKAHSNVPAIRQLADRVLENHDWEHISNSFESAGVRQLPLQEQMHSPFRRVRQALLPPSPASAILLSGRSIEGLELFTPEPVAIEIRLEQRVLPHEARIPAEVMIQLDDRQPRMVRLSEEETVERVRLGEGQHALRVWLVEPGQQQFVTVRVTRAGSRAPLLEDETRTYHIAAPGQPARFYVKGPAWVRVDEWRLRNGSTTYRYVEPGWQTLALKAGNRADRYYRLYALRRAPEASLPEPVVVKADLAAPVRGPSPPVAAAEPVAWSAEDRYSPGAGLDSWGGYLSLSDRIDGSEDDVAPAQGAHSIEAGVSYRFRQRDRRLFSRSDLLLRRFDGSQDILGAKQWLDFYTDHSNWHLGLYGEAYIQPGEVESLEGNNHWSARVQGSIERTWQLSPRLRHKPGITLNQRWLSLDSATATALPELDPDIFSPYRDDHRRSLNLSDRLTWAPHLDQRLYLEGALVSNESLNPFDPDHMEVTMAGRQLFGSVAGEAGFRWRRYFADDDRSTSLDRKRIFVGGNLLRWGTGSHALTLRAEANYDIDRSDVGWRLRIGFEANSGRLSPARRPDELDFLTLRRAQQRERVETNRLDPIYP